MNRYLLGVLVTLIVGTAWALSGVSSPLRFVFDSEARNPVSHLRWSDDHEEFQFAIVSDRTGGHRANIFSQAVEKLNLMQPQFVLSVGDLIEGTKTGDGFKPQWEEFDKYAKKLSMPFFYVPGNHDLMSPDMEKFWKEKLGRRYYHFVYRNVLFLMLNSEDPPGSNGMIGAEQAAWAKRTLEDNKDVRWTLVFLHRPLWVPSNGEKNGWKDVESALNGRKYTVFVGHVHRYEKYVRQGMNYYQFATTGGGSLLRGPQFGEFDHIVWITMRKDGPLLANVQIDAILPENLKPIETDEPGKTTPKTTHPVEGYVYFEGTPAVGATLVLTPLAKDSGVKCVGVVEADGSFALTTYKNKDGAVEGRYRAVLSWKDRGISLLPGRYGKAETSGLTAEIKPGSNRIVFELRK
jgi:hypothetical protein